MSKRTAALLATLVSIGSLLGILVLSFYHKPFLLLILPWFATVIVAIFATDEYLGEAGERGDVGLGVALVYALILGLACSAFLTFGSIATAGANHQDPVCHQGQTLWLPPEALETHLDQQKVPVPGHEGDFYGTCEGGDPNYDVDPPIDDCAPEYEIPMPECDGPRPTVPPAEIDEPLVIVRSAPPAAPVVATPTVTG